MISRWILSNFKSFRKLDPINFSRITVLAGANSSGKSSIIQSILLLKQTLQYGSQNRTLTLNGPLLRLGSFEDVRNFNASGEPVIFGFDFSMGERDSSARSQPWMRPTTHHLSESEFGAASKLRLVACFESHSSEGNSQAGQSIQTNVLPFLTSIKLSIDRRTEGTDKLVEEVTYTRKALLVGDDDQVASFDYDIELDDKSREEIFSGKFSPSIRGGWLAQFLPSWILVNHDIAKQKANAIVASLFKPNTSLLGDGRYGDELVPNSVVERLNVWLKSKELQPIESGMFGAKVSELRRVLPRNRQLGTNRGILFGSTSKQFEGLEELREELLVLMLESTGSTMEYEPESPRSLGSAGQMLREYFKHGIRYLGPLRDGPRPVYQLEALESNTDVGYRGEHTAAVLELNGRSPISFRSPPQSESDTGFEVQSTVKILPLNDAVVEWLVYLGVADGVKTTDAGVFGNRLQVSTDSAGRLHDLTNVGVGVSQVLPIVVMSLLAPRGTMLIFEQPELHLHPRVQAKLADFFLSLALDNKQVLLETHSEYLVDRFRLRIALSESDNLKNLLGIFFTEKSQGQSTITPIEISEYGAIVNWPKDFFEQAQKDGSRIIQAATRKRKSSKQAKA